MRQTTIHSSTWLALGLILAADLLIGAKVAAALPETARDYSEVREECRYFTPLRQPFFGDTHIHTVYSLSLIHI